MVAVFWVILREIWQLQLCRHSIFIMGKMRAFQAPAPLVIPSFTQTHTHTYIHIDRQTHTHTRSAAEASGWRPCTSPALVWRDVSSTDRETTTRLTAASMTHAPFVVKTWQFKKLQNTSLFQMGMSDMEKYRYKNVEPVCILSFASEALKSSNSVGVDCNGCSSAHSVAHLTELQALGGTSPRTCSTWGCDQYWWR